MPLVVPAWAPQAPLHVLQLPWLARAGLEVAVLRLDLIDAQVSGNKWFKLIGHLQAAAEAGAEGLISLGGAHSNHLHALAAAGQHFGFPTAGLLRGEPQDSPTIADLRALGMQLHWLGYGGYRARHQEGFWAPWRERYPYLHPVPEGGGGLTGALGCRALPEMVRAQLADVGWADYDAWWLAAGTGTTLAGLVLAEEGRRPVHGALAVPGTHGVAEHVAAVLHEAARANEGYRLVEASRGGFARVDAELVAFLREVEAAATVPLEPVYTAKALMALRREIDAGYFSAGTRLVFVHTGGLQGRAAALAPFETPSTRVVSR